MTEYNHIITIIAVSLKYGKNITSTNKACEFFFPFFFFFNLYEIPFWLILHCVYAGRCI